MWVVLGQLRATVVDTQADSLGCLFYCEPGGLLTSGPRLPRQGSGKGEREAEASLRTL